MTLDGKDASVKLDVPVKLRVFDSLFVPLAKWSMLLTGNYRCITQHEPRSIRDAVHSDLRLSQSIYDHVDAIAQRLGADPADQVPFEKYAKAAESLLRPSSAARAVASGAPFIERVDLLVKLISHQLGAPNAEIDRTVQTVDQKTEREAGREQIRRAVAAAPLVSAWRQRSRVSLAPPLPGRLLPGRTSSCLLKSQRRWAADIPRQGNSRKPRGRR